MSLAISIGQFSDKGRKSANQDFYGALIPEQPMLDLKGIAIALADGISSSEVGSLAAQTAIKSFLTDYYGTPDTWPVKTAAHRVIAAANSWLHAQTRQVSDEVDSGFVTTLSVLVLKSRVAHIFHVGDTRISRLAGKSLEQLTVDHRVPASPGRSYLGRALGIGPNVEVDYRAVPVQVGDVFLLTTDGVHEHVDGATVARLAAGDDLDRAAREIAEEALRRGSGDNLTVQIARVESLSDGELGDLFTEARDLPLPPPLEPGMRFDGFRIVRQLHGNARSQVYLTEDEADGRLAVIKVPAPEMRDDRAYLQRFMIEDWIARQISSPHTLRVYERGRSRGYLYIATEYVDGQTLTQWMIDQPQPPLEAVRDMVEQIAKGLRAFHRLELVHQDLRPDNVMIDRTGTAKIIDFGSTKVPGVIEAQPTLGGDEEVLGTLQYTAPEALLGLGSTERSDIFSLGVIAYQLLTGELPYGASAARMRSRADVAKLRYVPVVERGVDVPNWVDRALQRAVHPDPEQRYEVLSEFTHDLRKPGPDFAGQPERMVLKDQLRFWKVLSLALAATVAVLLVMLLSR